MRIYMNSLDIDYYNPAYPIFQHVLEHIANCRFSFLILYRESASGNGYHVKIYCRRKCDICRMVFDDQVRYHADLVNRTEYERNVLFLTKTYFKAGETIRLKAGKWKLHKLNAPNPKLHVIAKMIIKTILRENGDQK